MATYQSIAKRSFIAKWKIYLFDRIINEIEPNPDDFKRFYLNDEIVKIYVTEYWQELATYEIKGKTLSQIEKEIKNYEKDNPILISDLQNDYILNYFPQIFSQDDFQKLKEERRCYYCDISLEEIDELGTKGKLHKKNYRGWNLEIDRKSPNLEYSKDNCVMSCYWCNNAKTDEFDDVEFKQIGFEIGKVLKNRLEQNRL